MHYLKNQNNIYVILLGICLLFFIPYTPPFVDLCYDGGVFQYMGMIIDTGQVPYTNAFDHKPPFIFILNYLGFLITPNSIWGIFGIFSLLTFFAAILIYKAALKRTKNEVLSLLFSTIFIALNYNDSILEEYNLTRQFTSLLSVYILYLIFDAKQTKSTFIWIGSLIGIIFFTQQNEILGVSFITAYAIAFSKQWQLNKLGDSIKNGLLVALGVLIPCGVLALIVLSWNNFDDFIDQAFLFNMNKYIGDDTFIDKVWRTISRFFVITGKLSGVLLVTLVMIIRNIVISIKSKIPVNTELKIIGIALFLQLLSSSLSGRAFGHYFLMFIPLIMYILMYSYRSLESKALTYTKYAILIVLCFQAVNRMRKISSSEDKAFYEAVNAEINHVKEQPGQFYPFNPRYLRINFNYSITSPSVWIYNHTAFLEHFPKGKIFNEIVQSLRDHKTQYILTDSTRGIDPVLQVLITERYDEILSDGGAFKLYKIRS